MVDGYLYCVTGPSRELCISYNERRVIYHDWWTKISSSNLCVISNR